MGRYFTFLELNSKLNFKPIDTVTRIKQILLVGDNLMAVFGVDSLLPSRFLCFRSESGLGRAERALSDCVFSLLPARSINSDWVCVCYLHMYTAVFVLLHIKI